MRVFEPILSLERSFIEGEKKFMEEPPLVAIEVIEERDNVGVI